MRSAERVVDQCGCQVRDADRIDNLLRTQDTPTAVVSRWIAAAGDPDYRDAFLTILKGPMTGHRILINVGRGVRKVTQLQAERAMSVGTGSAVAPACQLILTRRS
jgi:hypothetical protein